MLIIHHEIETCFPTYVKIFVSNNIQKIRRQHTFLTTYFTNITKPDLHWKLLILAFIGHIHWIRSTVVLKTQPLMIITFNLNWDRILPDRIKWVRSLHDGQKFRLTPYRWCRCQTKLIQDNTASQVKNLLTLWDSFLKDEQFENYIAE